MKFNILEATPQEIEEELNKGYFKQIVLGIAHDMPKEAKKAFLYIGTKIKQSEYYKDSYSTVYVEEYMPMMGKVWRLFVYDKQKAIGQLHNTIDNCDDIEIKKLVGSNQIISIYYDNDSVLGVMDVPYFEIYDGNDIERFFTDEYKELLEKAKHVLKEKM